MAGGPALKLISFNKKEIDTGDIGREFKLQSGTNSGTKKGWEGACKCYRSA